MSLRLEAKVAPFVKKGSAMREQTPRFSWFVFPHSVINPNRKVIGGVKCESAIRWFMMYDRSFGGSFQGPDPYSGGVLGE